MTYRKIKVEDKIQAVKRVFWGEGVSSVAADMGVGRNSLAVWVRKADTAMRSILGRKQAGKRRATSDGAQLKRLRAKIARQEKTIKTVCHYLKMSLEGPVPSRCLKCGCARFYKNGFFMIGIAHLLGECFYGGGRKIPVQKFVCVNCGKSTRLRGSAALFHWATSNNRLEMGELGHGRRKSGRKQGRTRPAIMMRMMRE
jgi:transposase